MSHFRQPRARDGKHLDNHPPWRGLVLRTGGGGGGERGGEGGGEGEGGEVRLLLLRRGVGLRRGCPFSGRGGGREEIRGVRLRVVEGSLVGWLIDG